MSSEGHAERLLAEADALERLHRPAQAVPLLRRVIRVGGDEAVAEARRRLGEGPSGTI